ncbi:MAG: CDP-diacylglycerol--glycerol-3-phosphate 3-phosphatidyltransferase [Hyphomonadaceae bacterium]|nr:CDP-diacylglycerol--glycerol-3-phosphate 3-phosphatidyltransferase [Hyphomonadaceae bacterium]
MNLPTLLTLLRIILGPIIAALILWAANVMYADPLLAGFIYASCFILFALAALTDWLDGWLARKTGAVTPLGTALDHAADKVLVTCVLIALAYAALPLNLVAAALILLGRDVAIAGLREGLAAQGGRLPVGGAGKWKAATAMAGVGAFLLFQTASLLRASAGWVLALSSTAQILLWIAAALALLSAVQYLAALLRRD